MNLKTVLIVTYYWPPAGGPGVQRWLKFAKYLPEFGITPIIYTPENPSYPFLDKSLLNEVPKDLKIIRTKIWEPYRLAEFFNPKSKEYKAGRFEKREKQSLFTKFLVYIRGNFFIPDARKFWVSPSVRFLNDYLKKNQIDVLITTGPPHSMHLIGLELKNIFPKLKWIADFRDPWTQISYHSELKLDENSQQKHKTLEKSVICTADCVLATSFTDAKNYERIGAKRVETITNGFESSDFKINKRTQTEKFRITYSGNLEIARNPLAFWQALKELIDTNEDFKNSLEINFYGNLSLEVENTIIENGLLKHIKKHGYVTHQQSIEGIVNAELLLITNFDSQKSKGIIPGKLFEYLATKNPIIAIGPKDGDVSEILKSTKAGKYFNHSGVEEIKSYVNEIFNNFKLNHIQSQQVDNKRFSRIEISLKLSKIIKNL